MKQEMKVVSVKDHLSVAFTKLLLKLVLFQTRTECGQK